MVTLDVLIPTCNRENLLRLMLDSILRAEIPAGLTVHCTVVDNNSCDNTKDVVEEYASRRVASNSRLVHYLFEPQQGKSRALNAGITATNGEWIGMIDDDEEIAHDWFVRALEQMEKSEVDFFGGPCLPNLQSFLPSWVTPSLRPNIGWYEYPALQDFEFVLNDGKMAFGGNIFIRRSTLNEVGSYNISLGRTQNGFFDGEDEEMHERLLTSGARGFHIKSLVIYHHIPQERLKKSYHRKKAFHGGLSREIRERKNREIAVTILGIPRWLMWRSTKQALKVPHDFKAQLQVILFVGFVWGLLRSFLGRFFKVPQPF